MTDVNEKTLCDVLQKQGYTVIEFNKIFNDENVAQIIDDLKLADITHIKQAFSFMKNDIDKLKREEVSDTWKSR